MATMGDPFAPGGPGNSQSPNPPTAPTPGADAQEVGYQHNSKYAKSKKPYNEANEKHGTYRNELKFFNTFNNYERFFTIKTTNGTPMSTIDTITAYEDLKKHIGAEPKKIVEKRDGNLTVSVSNEEQSQKMRSLKKLANVNVTCSSDNKMNQSQGTIRYDNYPGFTEDKIKNALEKFNVTDIYQLTKRNPDKTISKIPIYILTFNSTQLPTSVTIGWTRCSVRLYIPKPRRCFKCQKFGHSSTNCRSREEVCATCSLRTHDGACTAPPKCSNCSEYHPSFSRTCPTYLKEQEVIAFKVKNNVSFPEARQEVSKRYLNPNSTYSSMAASQATPRVQSLNPPKKIFYQTEYTRTPPPLEINSELQTQQKNTSTKQQPQTTSIKVTDMSSGSRSEPTQQPQSTSDSKPYKPQQRGQSTKRTLENSESPGERAQKSLAERMVKHIL